jgi:hypothetical protein
MTINRKATLASIATILLLALVLPWACLFVKAQANQTFTRQDKFAIPQLNSVIDFGSNGSYAAATFENNAWTFTNLRLINSGNRTIDNFKVSAQNSNVTITTIQKFNTTGAVLVRTSLNLRYTVVGVGKQTFSNLGSNLKGGDWNVIVNREYIGENHGWQISPDGTLTVACAPAVANVSIIYYAGPGSTANQSFFQQHSFAIVTGIALVIAVFIVLLIREVASQKQLKTHSRIIR